MKHSEKLGVVGVAAAGIQRLDQNSDSVRSQKCVF